MENTYVTIIFPPKDERSGQANLFFQLASHGKSGSLCKKKRRADIPNFSYSVTVVVRECNNVKVPLCPLLLNFRKMVAFWKVSRRLRPFVLLEQAACR